jgi:hypothetical protein
MSALGSLARAALFALAALLLCKSPAVALDLFATHEVTVQFATPDGKAMAGVDVTVFGPGDPTHAVTTGKTDKDGKFVFGTDRDGMWTAVARNGDEVARATIRVGGDSHEPNGISPYIIIGGLGVLLLMAIGYRFLRARARAGPRR